MRERESRNSKREKEKIWTDCDISRATDSLIAMCPTSEVLSVKRLRSCTNNGV